MMGGFARKNFSQGEGLVRISKLVTSNNLYLGGSYFPIDRVLFYCTCARLCHRDSLKPSLRTPAVTTSSVFKLLLFHSHVACHN